MKKVWRENQFILIEIDEETADEIRDWASDELRRKRFDVNYELTTDGKILEELIDIFYSTMMEKFNSKFRLLPGFDRANRRNCVWYTYMHQLLLR